VHGDHGHFVQSLGVIRIGGKGRFPGLDRHLGPPGAPPAQAQEVVVLGFHKIHSQAGISRQSFRVPARSCGCPSQHPERLRVALGVLKPLLGQSRRGASKSQDDCTDERPPPLSTSPRSGRHAFIPCTIGENRETWELIIPSGTSDLLRSRIMIAGDLFHPCRITINVTCSKAAKQLMFVRA
jgi:hypothetical protein